MNTCSCTLPLAPPRPWFQRWLYGWVLRWRAHAQRVEASRRFELMTELSAEMLKDIGAPEWLVAEAEMRHESPRDRRWSHDRDARYTQLRGD